MPSDRRLHPLSILFNIGRQFGAIALPLVLILVGRGTDEDRWNVYALLFLVPYTGIAVGRYSVVPVPLRGAATLLSAAAFSSAINGTFRIRGFRTSMRCRTSCIGWPEWSTSRIQTGGGSEPEATLSVLTLADLDEMRRRVFANAYGRTRIRRWRKPRLRTPRRSCCTSARANSWCTAWSRIAGSSSLAPRSGWPGSWRRRNWSSSTWATRRRGVCFVRFRVSWERKPALHGVRWAWPCWALILFLLLTRVFSVIWALIRLHGFRLTQQGDDLRAEYGLLTRVAATIPRRRIQTITIRESIWHRMCGRAAVRVATAGGKDEQRERVAEQREWLAPIVLRDRVPDLLDRLLPRVDLRAIELETRAPSRVPPGARAAPGRRRVAGLARASGAWNEGRVADSPDRGVGGSSSTSVCETPWLGDHRRRSGVPRRRVRPQDHRGAARPHPGGGAGGIPVRPAHIDGPRARRYRRRRSWC